jgi:hypothetical protein
VGYAIVRQGESRSFPDDDPFLAGAVADGEVVLYLGAPHVPDPAKKAILIELGAECLGAHTGEGYGDSELPQDHHRLGILEIAAKPAHVGIRSQMVKRLAHLIHDVLRLSFLVGHGWHGGHDPTDR